MAFHLLIMLTLLTIFACSLVTSLTTSGVTLHQQYCTKQENLPTDVHFIEVRNVAQCSQMFLLSQMTTMLVLTDSDGSVLCGWSREIPPPIQCTGDLSEIEMYYSMDALPVCPVVCDKILNLLGVEYCAHVSTTRMTYDDGVEYCSSLNGSVAEADTRSEIEEIASMIPADQFMFLGAREQNQDRIFRWNRGDVLRSDLWLPNEPNIATEFCVIVVNSIAYAMTGLVDLHCHWTQLILCTMLCREEINYDSFVFLG